MRRAQGKRRELMDASQKEYRRASLVIMAGILATTLPQQGVLASIPLRNMLKNEMHLDRTTMASFLFWAGFAWYLKPLAGVLTDAFPLFGTRRRSYMLIGSICVTIGWLATALVPHTFGPMLAVMVITGGFMVVGSCATGGLLVETAQGSAASGRLSSLRQVVSNVCAIIAAPVSGYLAQLAFGWTALSCAVAAFMLVPVALRLLKEGYHPPASLRGLGAEFRNIARARTMWAASGLMLLFYIAPGTSTALFFKQQNELHMSTVTLGWITTCTCIAAIATALVYSRLCEHLSLKVLLLLGIGAAALTGVIYVFYNSITAAFIIDITNGVGYTLAELAFLDLATRATPRGSESLGYSLMLSVRNLSLFGTDILGSKLMDSYGWSFNSLVYINAATTALALPLVFLLPQAILRRHDA